MVPVNAYELLSPKFVKEVEKSQSPKAKASEMEHAIRKHCKVHFEQDPALYTKLSEKLEALIQKYRDDWNELYTHVPHLRLKVRSLPGGMPSKLRSFR
jgi:type I restriction enzyme R subunit